MYYLGCPNNIWLFLVKVIKSCPAHMGYIGYGAQPTLWCIPIVMWCMFHSTCNNILSRRSKRRKWKQHSHHATTWCRSVTSVVCSQTPGTSVCLFSYCRYYMTLNNNVFLENSWNALRREREKKGKSLWPTLWCAHPAAVAHILSKTRGYMQILQKSRKSASSPPPSTWGWSKHFSMLLPINVLISYSFYGILGDLFFNSRPLRQKIYISICYYIYIFFPFPKRAVLFSGNNEKKKRATHKFHCALLPLPSALCPLPLRILGNLFCCCFSWDLLSLGMNSSCRLYKENRKSQSGFDCHLFLCTYIQPN